MTQIQNRATLRQPPRVIADNGARPKPVEAEVGERRDAPTTVPAPEPSLRAPQADAKPAAAAKPPGNKRKKLIGGLIGALALVAAAGYGTYYWKTGRFIVSTDDAYVGAELAQISARVSARVADVPVRSNQHVTAGEPIVILDDADFKLAVDQAKARVATQQATIERIGTQIESSRAAVEQAKAQLEAARADLARAEADFNRTETLAGQNYSSRAALDAARATRDRARATVTAGEAALLAAQTNVSVLQAQQVEAERTLKEQQVNVAKAERDLEATVIRAPLDGVVGNKSVQVGDYVTPGKRLAALVPSEGVYVDANFKETQLARIGAGSVAHVEIDAIGGEGFDAKVSSIAPASGSQFSLLPPDNATGNFTKIVQRVPVRIAIPADVAAHAALRPGLSVVVTIDTRTTPRKDLPVAKLEKDQPVQR